MCKSIQKKPKIATKRPSQVRIPIALDTTIISSSFPHRMLNFGVFNGTTWNSQAAVVCLCLGNLAVLKTDLMAALEKGGEVGRWTKIVGSLRFISPKSTLFQDLVVFHTSLFGPQKGELYMDVS